jgi:hypothetical protein
MTSSLSHRSSRAPKATAAAGAFGWLAAWAERLVAWAGWGEEDGPRAAAAAARGFDAAGKGLRRGPTPAAPFPYTLDEGP